MAKSTTDASPHIFEMRTAAHFKAIASAVRDQILQVITNQAPWSPDHPDPPAVSVREIGAQLGRTPSSLYRHLDVLLDAGLIAEGDAEPSGGRDARTFRAKGEIYHIVQPDRRGPALEALCQYLERAGAHAGREAATDAYERTAAPEEYQHHEVPARGTISMFGWLDDDQLTEIRQAMFTIAEIFQDSPRRPGSRLVATSLFIRPVRLADGSTAEEPAG